MKTIKTGTESASLKRGEYTHFHCAACNQTLPAPQEGITTGYGVNRDNDTLTCFECCGKQDREEMIKTGKAVLYLTIERFPNAPRNLAGFLGAHKITNWLGTLEFKTGYVRKGGHNIAGSRYDTWFTGPDGKRWHGVQYGENTQVIHCKRVKR